MDPDRWRQVERALDLALESGPERWDEVIRRTCGTDPELLREVESLLERHGRARAFLESPPVAAAAALGAEVRASEEAEVREGGERIGPYRIVRPIGSGGMSRVFLAERVDGQYSQVVALKLLRPGLDTELDRARFRAERQILAALSHPNIARLLDGGVTGRGQPYLVLEYVDGRPVDRYCAEGFLTVADRVELFCGVADAVQYAHRSLVVHRDLKPSNVLVTPEGTVKLLDFGLAKLLETDGDGSPQTRTGHRWMTPEYAAPEQILGEPVTTLTDVYQLGVVLYELLTGALPFAETGGGLRSLESAVLDRDPPLPSVSAARRGEAGSARILKGDLDAIVLQALRKEPERRYPSAAALRDDLRRYLEGRPVKARADGAVYRLHKFVRRNVGVLAAGAAASVTLVGATVVSVRGMQEAERQRDVAVRERERADAQVDFQNLLLSEVGDRPVTMKEVLDAGRVLLERRYESDPSFLGTILLQLASSYADLGDTEVRAELLQRAESLALAGTGGVGLAPIRCQVADNLRMDGRYEEAWATLEDAQALLGSEPDPSDESSCLGVRGVLAKETGRAEESESAARRGLALREGLGRTRDMEYLGLLNTLAGSLHAVGRYREAVEVFQRLIEEMDRSGRGGMLSRAIMRHNLALTLLELGENAEAEAIFREALEQAARADPGGRIIWQPTVHYAEAALTQARADSALAYFDRIVRQAVEDGNLYWEGRGVFGRARALLASGRLDAARHDARRLGEILVAHPAVKGTDDLVPDARILGGLIALAEGDTIAARTELLEGLRENGWFEGRRRKRLRPVAVWLAEAELAAGDPVEALRFAREAGDVATVDSIALRRSANVGEARLVVARALLATGDATGALSAALEARVALRAGAGAGHPRTREVERLLGALTPCGAAGCDRRGSESGPGGATEPIR